MILMGAINGFPSAFLYISCVLGHHVLFSSLDMIIDTHQVCVDVGAAMGLFAIYAKLVLRAGVVVSIEPAPESYRLCVDNIAAALGVDAAPMTLPSDEDSSSRAAATTFVCLPLALMRLYGFVGDLWSSRSSSSSFLS